MEDAKDLVYPCFAEMLEISMISMISMISLKLRPVIFYLSSHLANKNSNYF